MKIYPKSSPTFLAPGTGFMEEGFSTDWGGGWFQDNSSALHLLCTSLLLHKLYLRLSGIRAQMLGTPGLRYMGGCVYFTCKYYAILYEELEHPWILVSLGVLETNFPTDTEEGLY